MICLQVIRENHRMVIYFPRSLPISHMVGLCRGQREVPFRISESGMFRMIRTRPRGTHMNMASDAGCTQSVHGSKRLPLISDDACNARNCESFTFSQSSYTAGNVQVILTRREGCPWHRSSLSVSLNLVSSLKTFCSR